MNIGINVAVKKLVDEYGLTYEEASRMAFEILYPRFRRIEIMEKLENLFDEWIKKEIKDIDSGRGSRGPDGILSQYPLDDLFNEIMWRLK